MAQLQADFIPLNTPWSPAKPGLYPCSPGEALVRPNSSCRTSQSYVSCRLFEV